MLTAVLQCAQPLNKQDMHRLQIFFETTPFYHAYLPVNKRLRNLG